MPWPQELAELRRFVPLLVQRARKAAPVESTLAFILDEVSDGCYAALEQLVQDPAFVDRALALLPASYAAYGPWCRDLLTALVAMLTGPEDEDEEDEDEEGGEGGEPEEVEAEGDAGPLN